MSEPSKLKDLVIKSQSRIAEVGKMIDRALDAFSSEANKVVEGAGFVNAQLGEWENKIHVHEETISRLEEKLKGLRTEVDRTVQKKKDADKEYSSLSSEATSTQKEILKTGDNLKQYQSKIKTLKTDVERLDKERADLSANLESMKRSNEKEFENLSKGYTEAQEKIKEISEKEPVIDILLREGKTEPPEVTIVSELISQNGEISVNDLKKTTGINSAVVGVAIDSLEQKGILSRLDKDRIKLLKT